MNKLLILILLTLSFSVSANDNWEDCELNDDGYCVVESETLEEEVVKEKTPARFKDSKIRRKTKDGRMQEFDGDRYKIVPRTQKRYKKKVQKRVIRPVIVNEKKRHNVSLLAGIAPRSDFKRRDISANRVEVEHGSKLHFGLSYSYDLLEINDDLDLSVGGLIQTNESIMGSIGLSF